MCMFRPSLCTAKHTTDHMSGPNLVNQSCWQNMSRKTQLRFEVH